MVEDRVFVGLGANVGDAAPRILRVMAELDQVEATQVVARSSLYRTAPIGMLEQPDFINAVVHLRTALDPEQLLDQLLAIEIRHGRVRTQKNGPRTLDLDLLIYGDRRQSGVRLTLPHPRMHERAFVLLPLSEIAPTCVIPGMGPVAPLLPSVSAQGVTRIAA